MRIGHGYDVHRLAENRRLVLGGVVIPYEKGLLGHSDADVLAHALADALLGAMAKGDIGAHFPDSDDSYLNADSMVLLGKVISMMRELDYKVENIDCTIIAERPKLAPYIESMRENIANVCGARISDVNVKATTEEGLGLSGEGMAAHAVVLISEMPPRGHETELCVREKA